MRHVLLRGTSPPQAPAAGGFRATSEALAGVVVGTLAAIRHPGRITFNRAAKAPRRRPPSSWPGLPDTGCCSPLTNRATLDRPECCGSPSWDTGTGSRISTSTLDRFSHGTRGVRLDGLRLIGGVRTANQHLSTGSMGSTFVARVPSKPSICNSGHQQQQVDGIRLRRKFRRRRGVAAWQGSNRFVGTFRRNNRSTSRARRTGDILVQNSRADAVSSRCSQKIKDADRFRLRYRMWLTRAEQANIAEADGRRTYRPAARQKSPGTFEKGHHGVHRRAGMVPEKLKTGRKAVPPRFVNPNEIATAPSLPRNEQFTKWHREQGIRVFGHVTRPGPEEVGPAGPEEAAPAGLRWRAP